MSATVSEVSGEPISSKNYSQDDLENIYSGGQCFELALWLQESNPDRFELWEATSQLGGGENLGRDISAHWFVKDKMRNVFIDVYGDSGDSPESVLSLWPDFDGDTTVKYVHWTDILAARSRIVEEFSYPYEIALSGCWRENAQYVSERLNLIKSA